jgi:hypothetical protein
MTREAWIAVVPVGSTTARATERTAPVLPALALDRGFRTAAAGERQQGQHFPPELVMSAIEIRS